MNQVLSQNEVDALLAAVSDGDVGSPEASSKESIGSVKSQDDKSYLMI
jgi:flagellar motor switch protein FliM